jgi:Holliday junction resolvasome RuvABC ATP-dependent DNA helicase subunit
MALLASALLVGTEGTGRTSIGRMVAVAMGTVLPATSHTAVITQPDLLHAFIEPFLKGETPKGMFQ